MVGKRGETVGKNRPRVRHGHVHRVFYSLTEGGGPEGATGSREKQRHLAWLTTATLAAQARMIGVSPRGVSM
jgi:hypothetical protein